MQTQPSFGDGPTHWTIEHAAAAIAAQEGWHEGARDTLRRQMFDAARRDALVVRHPHTDLPVPPHERAKVRDFYDLVTRDDVNAWLESVHAPYRWVGYEHAAAEPRYIGGRKLWKLAEAIETIAALPGLGVTSLALMKRATKAAASRELRLRDVEDGSPKWGNNLSGLLGEWLFAEDLNAWLASAGFRDQYRLPDDLPSEAARTSAEPAPATEPVQMSGNEWKERAREAARAIVKKAAARDLYPSQKAIADEIAADFRKLGIFGADGKPLAGATIKRHALRGISSATKKAQSTAFNRGK